MSKIRFAVLAVPPTPPPGKVYLFIDPADKHIKTIDDTGTVRDLTTAAIAAHASTHENGGGDELSVAGLSGILADPQKSDVLVASGPTNLSIGAVADGEYLRRSGSSIVGGTPSGGGGGVDPRDIVMMEHFLSSNIDLHEMFKHGWEKNSTGAGNSLSVTGYAGHPGVAVLDSGTSSNGFNAISLGSSGFLNIIMGGATVFEFEALIRLRGSIASSDVANVFIGFGDDFTAQGNPSNFVGVRFNPALSSSFQLFSNSGGTGTVQNGTTSVVLDTWYRVGFVYDPNGTPSLQMKVNGANEGSSITTNIPSSLIAPGLKHDSAGGVAASLEADYFYATQQIAA